MKGGLTVFETLDEQLKQMGETPSTPGRIVLRYLGILALAAVMFGALALAIMVLES